MVIALTVNVPGYGVPAITAGSQVRDTSVFVCVCVIMIMIYIVL